MAAGKLMWIGVLCCLGALLVNLFPESAFDAGMQPDRAWAMFGFGLFLIVLSVIFGRGSNGAHRE